MKKIVSILICVFCGVTNIWGAAGSATIHAYARYDSNGDGIVDSDGGGKIKTSAQQASYWGSGDFNDGTIENDGIYSYATGVGFHGGLTGLVRYGYGLRALVLSANNGYYFIGWYDESGNCLTTNTTYEKNYAYNASGDINVFAYFKPVTVQSATNATISTTDLEGSGTATVTFNVANADDGKDFTASIEGDAGFKIIEDPTWTNNNVVTITIQYTDQNKHGTNIASTKVTLTSKGDPNSKATATIYATSNLTPTFTKPADYNYGTIYANDILSSEDNLHVITKNHAASQASPAATGKTGASWTASLSGINSNQFQLVNANPQYGAFEVIYKPTEVGTHTATLSISVTYTDAKGTTIPSGEQIVTLTGQAEQPTISAIVFNPTAVDFNEQVTGYTGSQKVTVSQQNVANVEYSWGETNAANVFSYAIAAGSVTISAKPTAPGNYNATLTATGEDTRNEYLGQQTKQTLNVSIAVGLQSPVLQGGSNLKDTYYLKWNKIPHASTYNVYEVNGDTKSLISATDVADDGTYITRSIASTAATKTYIIEAVGTYEYVDYKSWSNQVTLNLNTLTQTGTPYLDIYTGTNLTNLKAAGFASTGTVVPKKKVNLINTFDVNGKPLFDELYVFGETVSDDGKTTMTAATTDRVNSAVTPCYVFTKTADGYKLIPGESGGPTIGNVNQAEKPLPNTTDRCWTIAAGDNKKLYFTGFCPFGSNGYTKDDEGIIYIKGAAGATVDVYLEDCQLYSRQHKENGDAATAHSAMETFTVPSLGGEWSDHRGSASAIVFECIGDDNMANPFRPTIHTMGENLLYSQKGCSGYGKLGKDFYIGQYCASMQVRVTTETSYTILSFDDKWPTNAQNYEEHKRTNGYIAFKKPSTNSPSIEIGNKNTVVNFNGGQIELQNSAPASPYYLNTLAICCRLGEATISLSESLSIPAKVGYGLGGDEVGGEVNFNDGTVNALTFKPKAEHSSYFTLDENGFSNTLRCPENTYITGGSHNSEVRACSAVDRTGHSPKDRHGNTLVKLDYQLPGEKNIQVDPLTGLVVPESMPAQLTCTGCGENGSNTVLDLEKYGKQSLSPDDDNYIHLWAPGAGLIDYAVTSWVMCMTKVEADASITDVSLGGDRTVPSSETDKVNNLLYAQVDNNIIDRLEQTNGGKYTYKVPFNVPGSNPVEYTTADINSFSSEIYSNILNEKSYEIQNSIYYARIVEADEWIMFSPPFDVSNVYVIETSSESNLENITSSIENGRQTALQLQAEYNMDCAAILAASIALDISANSNRSFTDHYNSYLSYAANSTNKQGKSYKSDVKKIQLKSFTGNNYDANFFLYKSADNEWQYEDGAFVTDWNYAQPVEKLIGEKIRTVLMEQGGIYALQFPFCPKCEEEGAERTEWDYWTGKFIIFEGFGPQTIAGTSAHTEMQTFANAYATENVGQLVGNPVFAEYEVTPTDKTYFCDSYNNLQHDGEDNIMKAGDVFMLAKLPPAPQGLQRKVDFETGSITWEEDNSNDGTTTSTPTISGNRQMMVYTIDGGVGIIPVTAQQVSIYNAAGQLITSQYLTEEVQIPLPAGIYLISGEKEQAKVIVK